MQTALVNGASIAYVEAGPKTGFPVVLSHSLFFDHGMFEALTAILVEHGFHVIAYDHRGQGASQAGTRAELSIDRLTEDAAALLQQLALGPVHFVGNSLGGFVALRLAARHPGLLRTAVAVGSSAEEEHSLAAFAPLVEHLCAHGAGDVIGPVMHIMFGDQSLATAGPMTEHWGRKIAALGPSIGDAAYEVIHRARIVEELAGCGVPVLAIAGREDHAYPPPTSSEHIARATGGTCVVVDGAGHSVSLEQPAAVAAHLLAHFAAHFAAHAS